jgi:hypothetical protein
MVRTVKGRLEESTGGGFPDSSVATGPGDLLVLLDGLRSHRSRLARDLVKKPMGE